MGNVLDDGLQQLARLGQGIFDAFLFGHVLAHDDDIELSVGVAHGPGGFSHPEQAPVLAHLPEIPAEDFSRSTETVDKMLLHAAVIIRVNDSRHWLTDQLVGLVAQFGGGGGIDRQQCPPGVDRQQHFGATLEQRTVSLLADA